ncbi:serine/threonine-protein kinase BLUS1 isoform X1 [Carex littledalei]|uniref:Serine/threonine-protein kinase BLUS1 isoform X1 n=1 Tax=Carex littledalei TaxID=544730 RepID=A0A833VRZ5_9POAL|nr:serine/threonine-protein kinase BLUS1 isoform X1 [Carex littledalei]
MDSQESEKRLPANPQDYKLYEEIGEGVSATVYRALCVPLNEIVAIKVLDLEKCNNDLDGIRREVQTMSLIHHPNLLRAYCSFTSGHHLWVVMPYMAGGSALHIMKTSFPEGFDEPIIATLLREVLKALVYLHYHGHIHRDVKAGNILLDGNGAVKLADFGVSACMFDTGDRQRSRNTFVGTPCWMAPEVMQQLHGYDFKADVWSFGITALELAHGHAPFSKYPPMKVLLMTLQNAPPGLDYDRDKKFSRSFKDLVGTCLVKDPKKRPSSEKLLKHPFFKQARTVDYLAKTILEGMPPLGDRFSNLKEKEANIIHNKFANGDMEQLSQQEYMRGISGWNFNLEDLKAQAALMDSAEEGFNPESTYNGLSKAKSDFNFRPVDSISEMTNPAVSSTSGEDVQDWDGQFVSAFQGQNLQALKNCFDVCEEDSTACSLSPKGLSTPESLSPIRQPGQLTPGLSSPNVQAQLSNSDGLSPPRQPARPQHVNAQTSSITTAENSGSMERSVSESSMVNMVGIQKFSSGSLIPEHVLSPFRNAAAETERELLHQKQHLQAKNYNHSGPLMHHSNKKDPPKITSEERSQGTIVEQRGRFKVTKQEVIPKVSSLGNLKAIPVSKPPTRATLNANSILPSLQFLLNQNAMQKEEINKIITCIEQSSGLHKDRSDGAIELSQAQQSIAPVREKEMQAQLASLQQSVQKLSEELQRVKLKNAQMEQEINALSKRETSRLPGKG